MTEAENLLAEYARIIGANQYMLLATADETGVPWASPVWFASQDGRDFYWASHPEARHPRTLRSAQLAIAIFDSTQRPGTGEGAYLSATGGLVPQKRSMPESKSTPRHRAVRDCRSGRARTSSHRSAFGSTARPPKSGTFSAPVTGGWRSTVTLPELAWSNRAARITR